MVRVENQELESSLNPDELTEAVLEAFRRCPTPKLEAKKTKKSSGEII